jgi:hypothetical protein
MNRLYALIRNKYVLAALLFSVWMLFLDNTSYMEQRILNKQLNELEDNKKYYQNEIKKDDENIKSLIKAIEKINKSEGKEI